MTVCFNENIYIKFFDEKYIYPLKKIKCKNFDGPNNFSIIWNQLLILSYNNIIYDKKTLIDKINIKILNLYKNNILNNINDILYKFQKLNYNSIKLYYNNYHIKNNRNLINNLINLYNCIYNL